MGTEDGRTVPQVPRCAPVKEIHHQIKELIRLRQYVYWCFCVSTVTGHLVSCHVKCIPLTALLVSSRMHSLLIFFIKRVSNIMHRGMESELGRMVSLRKLNSSPDESLSSLETESPGEHLCLEISTLKQVGMIRISKIMAVSLGKKKERRKQNREGRSSCFIVTYSTW